MRLKLALSVVLCVNVAAGVANARTELHLYSAVPVAGDHVMEIAYRRALDRCSFDLYPLNDRVGLYRGAYGYPEMRSCMSRMGFIMQNGEPFAYPVKTLTHVSR